MPSTRQLAAILFADIVGYTALMQHDEEAAMEKLHYFKEDLNEKVKGSGGQIIQFYGDGCLAIFNNPTEALQCAKKLQEIFSTQHRVPVRIGMHLGEILFEDGNIFGDSVNIASRIQSMSLPGGVLFSDTIKNQIKNKPEFQFKALGYFEFKNVDEPMEVFALSNEGFPVPDHSALEGKFKDPAKAKPGFKKKIKLAAALLIVAALGITGYFINKNFSSSTDPGKSIAVLAFTDMSPDKSQEHLGDGLADDIITALSKIKELKVIGRTSSFQFKGKNTDLREIGEKLNVAVVLEGSVQKSGNMLRVTAQLIDANDGTHIWSHKWDREITDIFSIQDEIATGISEKLKVTFLKKPGKADAKVNPEAYELYLQARQLYYSGRPLNRLKARELLLKSQEIDSSFSNTYALLSITIRTLSFIFPPIDNQDKQRKLDSARLYAEKALRLDPENSLAYIAMANRYSSEYNWIEVEKMASKAHELNPGATEKSRLSNFFLNHDYQDEALKLIREALVLEPLSPEIRNSYLHTLMRMRQFDNAISTAKKYLELDSNNIDMWTTLAYSYIGKKEYKEGLNALARQHESYGNKELANIYRTADYKTAISAWLEQSKTNKVMSSNNITRSIAYAMIQDKENTLNYLDSALESKDQAMATIKTHWLYDFVRSEPRFKEIYRKLNFDAYDEYRKTLR